MAKQTVSPDDLRVPAAHDWRTTDEDEINKRRLRARTENLRVTNTDPSHPVFSTFRVKSPSGLTYSVEVRDLRQRQFACDCVDFRCNGLGTCKHVEATLHLLERRHGKLCREALREGSRRIDLVVDRGADTLRIERGADRLPKAFQPWFDDRGRLLRGTPEEILEIAAKVTHRDLRISQEVAPWRENRHQAEERRLLRKQYEAKVHAGEWPAQETMVPLYPYQREGMLHLAFTERALLADEMGLGKTIQAIAACALLHRLGKAARVLVVTPASLKTEWEAQIQQFTRLPYQLIFGPRHLRLAAYSNAPFFTIVNYEQMVRDALDVNARLKPDVVILDEAQRIKNWNTQTAQAIKRLRSRYAFVLTGTPIENRIDEIHSIMSFLNPSILGPLFRFNREYYQLDERGHPGGYRNLEQLHARIRPHMLRRRKADVETELPDRTDKTFLVPLTDQQRGPYGEHEKEVARLMNIRKHRPLTQQQLDKLMRELAMMRMICDTNYILDPDDRTCPKLPELEKIFEECLADPEVKLIVFSEWERMLQLVRELCDQRKVGYAWHTGTVPQKRRRAEIMLFKSDPKCRVFLSTDSGSTGLNLQSASVVINCDLPWNPARLEQRIARAWRKHQTRPVTVIHLVSENTIEHRMLGTLANKQALADGVLDLKGDLSKLSISGGRETFMKKLEQIMAPADIGHAPAIAAKALPVDRARAFGEQALKEIDGALVRCEERYPLNAPHSVLLVVVERDAGVWAEKLAPLHQELFGTPGADPLAPVMLEVIDRATDEALRRMEKTGLIAGSTRAVRPLYERGAAEIKAEPLSEEDRRKLDAHRQHAARKLKMARLLGDGELADEARGALGEGILAMGRALAVRNRLPEPSILEEALAPANRWLWGEAFPSIQEFVGSPSAVWQPVATALEDRLRTLSAS